MLIFYDAPLRWGDPRVAAINTDHVVSARFTPGMSATLAMTLSITEPHYDRDGDYDYDAQHVEVLDDDVALAVWLAMRRGLASASAALLSERQLCADTVHQPVETTYYTGDDGAEIQHHGAYCGRCGLILDGDAYLASRAG